MSARRIQCAACAAAMCLASAYAGVDALSYIRKGLVAQLDGIENAGRGMHDPDAATWVDLTGNGHDGAMAEGMAWTENGWTRETNGVAVTIGPKLSAVTGTRTFTAECAVVPSRHNARQVFFGQFTQQNGNDFNVEHNSSQNTNRIGRIRVYFGQGFDYDGKRLDFLAPESMAVTSGEFATIGFTTTPHLQRVWKNGSASYSRECAQGLDTMALGTNLVTYVGSDLRESFAFRGTYHAFRVYDRALTDEELAVNAAVDAVRFNGADPAAVSLPAGWAFDAQTNLLATVSAVAMDGGTVRIGAGAPSAAVSAVVPHDGTATNLAITAEPNAGWTFVGWLGDTDAIVSGTVFDAAVTVSAGARLTLQAVFRVAGTASIPSSAGRYATDGLVIHLDGADNAGAGVHDPRAAVWTDLSGNGNHGAMDANVVWVANGWLSAGHGRPVYLGTKPTAVIASRTFTLEFACRPTRTAARECFFGGYNTGGLNIEHNGATRNETLPDGYIRLWYNSKPNYELADVTLDAGEDAVFSLVSGPDELKLYKNGTLVFAANRTITDGRLAADAEYYIGGEPQRLTMGFSGTYYSFRLYDRLLTADEVARNAAADRERLIEAAGAAPEVTSWTKEGTGTWTDAAAWDAGVPHPLLLASIQMPLSSATIDVAEKVPSPKGPVVVGNESGVTRIHVKEGGHLPLVNTLVLQRGSELTVGPGGTVSYDGSKAPADAAPIVLSGGRMTVDGGVVSLDNIGENMFVGSNEYVSTGTLAIASGAVTITKRANGKGRSGLSVNGGRLEMTGGRLTLRHAPCQNQRNSFMGDWGMIDMSGDSVLLLDEQQARLASGTFHLRDRANLTVRVSPAAGSPTQLRFEPGGDGEVVMTVDDDASVVMEGSNTALYLGLYRSDSTLRHVSILNWNSTQTLALNRGLCVGYMDGYAELNVTRGQVKFRGCGVGLCGGGVPPPVANHPHTPTGVVNIAGGSLLNAGNSGVINADVMNGLIAGQASRLNLSRDRDFYRGTINLTGGAITNRYCYLGMGNGRGEGDIVQTGGELRHENESYQMFMGVFGGVGRYVMSNGVATVASDVFVGGATTNMLYHKPHALYQYCPVDDHRAKGLLRVAGGSFSTDKTLWLSRDGEGTLEIGPLGAEVKAANVTLESTPAALTGDADLTSKVRFTCGPQGVGTLAVADTLTIGAGATLEVDTTALEAPGVHPLIEFDTCAGEFASVTVKGFGTVVKTAKGYLLSNNPGTMLFVR